VQEHPVATKRVVRTISKPLTSVPKSRSGLPDFWLPRATSRATRWRSKCCRMCPIACGARHIRRTPCASMLCACTRWA
jgi:hypothetical protein